LLLPSFFKGKGWGWVLLSISFLLFSCSACTSYSSPLSDHDSDSDSQPSIDRDSDLSTVEDDATDHDSPCSPYTGECELEETTLCRSGSLYQCVHTVVDGCVIGHTYKLIESCNFPCEVETPPTAGKKGVAKCGEYPDEDSPDYCPKLTEIDFPLTDKDGTMTFCRPCDTRTEKDPDCIANLWKDSNERLCVDEPQYDCCGYPCEMTNLKPRTKKYMEENESPKIVALAGYSLDRCDIMINPDWWDSGHYTFKTFGMSDGKILFEANNVQVDWEVYSHRRLYMEFDVKSLSYKTLTGVAMDNLSYYKNNLLASVFNIKQGQQDPDGMKYIIYRDKTGKMQLVYPNQVWDFALTPGLNEKWAFGSINEGNGEGTKIKYAKVGDPASPTGTADAWQWQEIGTGFQYFQSLVGDKVTFFLEGFKGYQCDLSKSPKSLTDCILLNRNEEQMRAPTMDAADVTKTDLIYYTPVTKPETFVRIDISKTPFEYKEFQYDIPSEFRTQLLGSEVVMVRDNLLLFHITYGLSHDDADRLKCYYRLDTNKTFCTIPVPWEYEGETGGQTDMGMGEIENHTLLWQDSRRSLLKARDMECYCDWNAELCPFDDYTPNTEHPKRDGFRDERCEDRTKCDYTDL